MLATDYAHHFSLSFYVFVGMLYVICACCCVRCNNIFVGALTKHIDLLLCQVNHFGSFVRFFFSLPAPTDNIPARMVLTTLDSAVHWSTSSPYGPVHINCPFREPLDNSPSKWMLSCLKGLDKWMSSAEPFTKYIQMQNSLACYENTVISMKQVIEIIQQAKRGLLLVGAIHTEDEIWAALLLAKHLNWPVVADILSGLRLRRLSSYFPKDEENVLFIDHLDHALLSDFVKGWVRFEVVIQV